MRESLLNSDSMFLSVKNLNENVMNKHVHIIHVPQKSKTFIQWCREGSVVQSRYLAQYKSKMTPGPQVCFVYYPYNCTVSQKNTKCKI